MARTIVARRAFDSVKVVRQERVLHLAIELRVLMWKANNDAKNYWILKPTR